MHRKHASQKIILENSLTDGTAKRTVMPLEVWPPCFVEVPAGIDSAVVILLQAGRIKLLLLCESRAKFRPYVLCKALGTE
jgi:hypothetical protein